MTEPPAAKAVPKGRLRTLLAKFTGASLIGFVFSVSTLHLGMHLGLPGWAARLIALLVAMNITFVLNGRFTFNALSRERFLPLWGAYLLNSSFGNACNYLVFLTLRSLHRPFLSQADVAFVAGAMAAWAINFLGARYVVFGGAGRRILDWIKARIASVFSRPSRRRARPSVPAPDGRGWSRR
jgi:putative flippase GtrA